MHCAQGQSGKERQKREDRYQGQRWKANDSESDNKDILLRDRRNSESDDKDILLIDRRNSGRAYTEIKKETKIDRCMGLENSGDDRVTEGVKRESKRG